MWNVSEKGKNASIVTGRELDHEPFEDTFYFSQDC
jgi:hypothetical protein